MKKLKIKKSVAVFGVVLTLVLSSFAPVFGVFAIEHPENYVKVMMRKATDFESSDVADVFIYDGGTVSIAGASQSSIEEEPWDYGDHQGTMLMFYTTSTALEFVTTPSQGYSAEARVDGNLVDLTPEGTYVKNDFVLGDVFEIEFEFHEDQSDPVPDNTEATFDYTYTGSAVDWHINVKFINAREQNFDQNRHANFRDSYPTQDGDTTVKFTIESLWIDVVDGLTINDVDYSDYIPTGREELAEHYNGGQMVVFDVTVPIAETYEITSSTHQMTEEELFMGNFLWDNDTSKLDTLDENDERRDDIIGHGTLEFVKAVYGENEYDSLEEVNNAGNLFYFKEDEKTGVGSATFPVGTELTVRLLPEAGYQLTSFGINRGTFEPQENVGEYTFVIRGGNGHLAADFEAVEDVVEVNAEAIESGSIELGGDEFDYGTARLDVNETDLSDEDIAGFEDAAGDYDISTYLDISLYQITYKGTPDDTWDDQINELENEATITLQLGEDVNGDEIVIVHQKHDGTYEVIPTTYDPVTHTITFKTSSFSNYAIATKTAGSPETGSEMKKNEFARNNIFEAMFFWVTCCLALALLVAVKRQGRE